MGADPTSSPETDERNMLRHPGVWHIQSAKGPTLPAAEIDLECESTPTVELHAELPPNIKVLGPKDNLIIDCDYFQGAVFDFDETCLANTIEYVHDGPTGRFARAARYYAAQAGQTISDDEWNSDFASPGLAEKVLAEAISAKVREKFHVNVTGRELLLKSYEILIANKDEMLKEVEVRDGIPKLEAAYRNAGVGVGVCTGSDEMFVVPASEHFQLRVHQRAATFSARKRIDEHVYTGESVLDTCKQLKADPERVAMHGDGPPDLIAAALAGVKFVAIAMPGGNTRENIQKFADTVQAAKDQLHRDLDVAEITEDKDAFAKVSAALEQINTTHCFLIDSFELIKLHSSRPADESAHPDSAKLHAELGLQPPPAP